MTYFLLGFALGVSVSLIGMNVLIKVVEDTRIKTLSEVDKKIEALRETLS